MLLRVQSWDDPFSRGGLSRTMTAPGVRARMTIPVSGGVFADALIAGGVAHWSTDGESALVGGWTRGALGVGYAFEAFSPFASLGNLRANPRPAGDPLGAVVTQTQPLGFSAWVLAVGIRGR